MKKVIIPIIGASLLLSGCNLLDGLNFSDKKDNENIGHVSEPNGNIGENNNVQQNVGSGSADNGLALEAQFFNDVEVVDGRKVIQNPLNKLALVNKEYGLPANYIPEDLVIPNVTFSFGNQDIEKAYLRKEAAEKLEVMFTAAKLDGIDLFAVSGYRSYKRQEDLFNFEVIKVGREQAETVVAFPGNSEHQSGLAMDISGPSVGYALTQEFGEHPEGQWLANNAHKYGFILRYPQGKEDITGYSYEPWHFRYVGEEAAAVMYEKDLTLEEYFNIVQKI